MSRDLSEEQRWEITNHLGEIPTACWADLVDWALKGHVEEEDDFGEITKDPNPDVSGGAYCALSDDLMRVGSCYCGKFRSGLEVTDGRS